jgi:beta-galactosidase
MSHRRSRRPPRTIPTDRRVTADGKTLQQGRVESLTLAPREKKKLALPVTAITPAPATEYFRDSSNW